MDNKQPPPPAPDSPGSRPSTVQTALTAVNAAAVWNGPLTPAESRLLTATIANVLGSK
jgi:hypothetical protein